MNVNKIVERFVDNPHIQKLIIPIVRELYFTLIRKHSMEMTWLGKQILQTPFDLWTMQETLWELQPETLIECGTYRGGSSFFYAQLFDLIGKGRVISIDVKRMHDLSHPRIDYLVGNSLSKKIPEQVSNMLAESRGPTMVILDSNHAKAHVRKELEIYSKFVTLGSFIFVQDGIIDVLFFHRHGRPGPLRAIEDFLGAHPEFVVDHQRCEKFVLTYHPMGWLKRQTLGNGAGAPPSRSSHPGASGEPGAVQASGGAGPGWARGSGAAHICASHRPGLPPGVHVRARGSPGATQPVFL